MMTTIEKKKSSDKTEASDKYMIHAMKNLAIMKSKNKKFIIRKDLISYESERDTTNYLKW